MSRKYRDTFFPLIFNVLITSVLTFNFPYVISRGLSILKCILPSLHKKSIVLVLSSTSYQYQPQVTTNYLKLSAKLSTKYITPLSAAFAGLFLSIKLLIVRIFTQIHLNTFFQAKNEVYNLKF